jgi:hypothetical protein
VFRRSEAAIAPTHSTGNDLINSSGGPAIKPRRQLGLQQLPRAGMRGKLAGWAD